MNAHKRGCLQYQKVLDIALSLEAAEKGVQELQRSSKINYLGKKGRHIQSKNSKKQETHTPKEGAMPCYHQPKDC